MPTPPNDRRLLVQVRRRRGKDERLRTVMISDLAPAGYLERKIDFDVMVTEWGDVSFGEAHIPLGARPRPHDFRIPFTLYSRVTRRALHDCDEGDLQYEVRGGRIYDYKGNLMVDPPTPRRPRSRDGAGTSISRRSPPGSTTMPSAPRRRRSRGRCT